MNIVSNIKPTNLFVTNSKPKVSLVTDIPAVKMPYSVLLGRGMPMGLLLSLTYPVDTTIIIYK